MNITGRAKMRHKLGNIFGVSLLTLFLFTTAASASDHRKLNGTWVLIPTRSDFAGQPMLQTGTVTINDREHHIYVSRSFNYDGDTGGFSYSFSTDEAENSTVRNGKTFKSKASWDGDVLKVKTTQGTDTTVERFSLGSAGFLTLVVDRPDHRPLTLVFERQ
jgi:hypothetical protein